MVLQDVQFISEGLKSKKKKSGIFVAAGIRASLHRMCNSVRAHYVFISATLFTLQTVDGAFGSHLT